MIILGVWDGTPSSAALIIDGKIINAVTEERLNRSKNAYGFPAKSIESILRQTGYKLSDIDEVAMTTASLSPTYFYTSRSSSGWITVNYASSGNLIANVSFRTA